MLLRFQYTRMPHTSQMWNLARGFEDLYYGLLFASAPEYTGDAGVWNSWIDMGVDLGVRDAPPGSQRGDRIKTSLRSAGKTMEVTITGGRDDLTSRVADVVEYLVGTVERTRGQSAPERAAALGKEEPVAAVIGAVAAALSETGVSSRDADVLLRALDRDIAAYSYQDLVSVHRDPA